MTSFPYSGSSLIFMIGLAVYAIVRVIYVARRRRVTVEYRNVSLADRCAMVLVFVGTFLLPLLHFITGWFARAQYALPPYAGELGTLVLIAAIWLFWRSHTDLGANWSPTLELRRDHHLVTTGVYTFIRHPMYASMWLYGWAQLLLVDNWIVGPAALITFGYLYFLRVAKEERMMLHQFGDQYAVYAASTGRVFPKWW